MCGINGIVNLNEGCSDVLRREIRIMNNCIIHRGPDSDGQYLKYPIAFGFRRLSIIDLSDTADQPMASSDGQIIIIFNGEIYNYIELKNELLQNGYVFKTRSDTEVIINSYIQYGERCVEKFNGMWAFAIYDFRHNKLFCSRDRLGVKPFYYCFYNNNLYFSSELKSLHKVCNLRNANLNKAYEYLAYGYRVNDGETFLEDCKELLPGTNLTLINKKYNTYKYWQLKKNLFQHDDALTYNQEYVRLFENAVKLRYRSDVPVALLLSGGLDSTSIAKVTDNLIERGELGQNTIQAFIASFPGFQENETPIAREFVKTCNHIQLHEIVIDPKDIINNFENTIYGLDHPLGSFASIAHNNIMKQCHLKGIKVVLNGQGSDEAFGGYDRYISGVHLLDMMLKGDFFKEFIALNRNNNYSAAFLLSQMFKSLINQNFSSYLRAKFQEKSISVLDKNFVVRNKKHFKSEYNFSIVGDNFNRYLLSQINRNGINTILHYEDVSSMNQSIEIRSPFMDYRMMEFAFSIPNNLKFQNGITKIIQRDTIGKMLPTSITKNRTKIGFKTPFTDYIANDPTFKAYISELLHSHSFKSKKIWDAEKIAKVFNTPYKSASFPFWRIINFEVWSRVYQISNL